MPEIDFTGDYEMSGNLVEHEVSGNGHFHTSLRTLSLPKEQMISSLYLSVEHNVEETKSITKKFHS